MCVYEHVHLSRGCGAVSSALIVEEAASSSQTGSMLKGSRAWTLGWMAV